MSDNNNQNDTSEKTPLYDDATGTENLAQTLQNIKERLDLVKNVANDIKAIKEDIKSIRTTDITAIKNDIAGLVAGVDYASNLATEADEKATKANEKAKENEESITELDTEVSELRSALQRSVLENRKLKEHVLKNESQERRSNLILDGIEETDRESCLDTLYKILLEKLEIENAGAINIDRCHRMGNGPKPRPMIFKVHFYGDREKIWNARRKLKDTGIWMREDYPVEIFKRRQILEPIRKEAVKKGKRAFLVYDKLILNGTSYTVDSVHTLPDALKPEEVATKRGDGITAFFSRSSPLSNFSPCLFKGSDGLTYSSTEQFYQHGKALCNGDQITANLIRNTDDPAECKRLGEKITIKNMREWEDKSLDVMYDGCRAKFQQNLKHRNFLLSTKKDVLAEANPRDNFWGIGLSINHKDIMNSAAWKGKNKLGEILVKIRDSMGSMC